MKNVLGKIKVVEDNLKILHRNLIGPNWFCDHEKLAEYYSKLSDMEDDVAEMIILLGGTDVNITTAVEYYRSAAVKKYTSQEAFSLTKLYFNDLITILSDYRETVPPDCQSELDTWIFWLRKEANYKITNLLAKF